MQNELSDFDVIVPERPKFLQVLCILTFICSAWVLLSNTFTVINADEMSQGVKEAQKEISKDIGETKHREEATFGKNILAGLSSFTAEKIRYSAIGTMIGQVFCLIGALLMWRLKKIGFFIYIIGVAIGSATPFIVLGNNFVAVGQGAFTAFFGLLFIVFYAMNLKAMK